MTNKICVYAGLCFKNFTIPASEIRTIIDIVPDIFYNAGEPTRAGRIAKFSFWSKDLGQYEVSMIDEAISACVDALLENADKIKIFSHSLNSDDCYINLSFTASNYYPSIFIDRDLILKLENIGLSLSVDAFNE